MRSFWYRMKGTMKRNIPEIAVVLISMIVLGSFVSMKEGFHMDELISFEFANAEYNPWIVSVQPQGRLAKFVYNEILADSPGETLSNLITETIDLFKNGENSKALSYKADVFGEPTWITGKQFLDYITVGSEDAFNYPSVYFNVLSDNHPPLHFMALHTISSIFQGKAEAWMGCLINMIAVAVILVLLMKTVRLLSELYSMRRWGRALGILCALLYGISTGAIATTLLIRMYGMLTLWCVLYFYLILKKWQDKKFVRHNVGLILVTMAGFWTQYFFLFYCILLAGVTAIALLTSRRFREFWCFVRSMVIAALIGIALFPFAIEDVFSSGRGMDAISSLKEGLSGYAEDFSEFAGILAKRTFEPQFWIMLLILALFAGVAVCAVLVNKKKILKASPDERPMPEKGLRRSRIAVLCMLIIPSMGYFLLAARMAPFRVDRYVMPVFPFVFLLGTMAMAGLLFFLSQFTGERLRRGLFATVCTIAVLLQAFGVFRYDGTYLYKGYAKQERFAEENAGKDCICIYVGVGYYENLKEFTNYEKTLLVTVEELMCRSDVDSVRSLDEAVILIKAGVNKEQALYVLTEGYGFELESDNQVDESPYGDTILLMRKGDEM